MSNYRYEKNRLISMNKLLIKGRWVYIVGITFIGIFSKLISGPNVNFPISLMTILFVGICALNILYGIFFHQPQKISYSIVRAMSFFQLIVDFIFYLIIIFFAGGLTSISFVFFFFDIIASAFFYSLSGVLLICALASVSYSSLIILQYLKIIPYLSRYGITFESYLAHNYSVVATNLITITSAYFIVGFFVGLIAKNLREKEQEIKNERDKEKAIINNLSDGLIFTDSNNIVAMVNRDAEKLLYFDKKEIIGKKISQINFNKNKDLKLLFNKKTREDVILTPKKHPDINLKVSTIEVKNKNNQFIGTIKIIHNISREKFIDKMKSEFITIASHQMRTPLSAIKFGLSLLLENSFGRISKKQRGILKQCYDNNNQLINLINDLLDAYSLEEGKFDNKFTKTNIGELIKEVSEQFKINAQNKKIEFALDLAHNLPKIKLDRSKIKLVLITLIDNSFKYTPREGKIEIHCQKKDKTILIKIVDTGIGIPKQNQNKIFSKFFRASNAIIFQTEGNGLGLYVAKSIIKNHNGKIWFKSKINQGTTFFVELPIK